MILSEDAMGLARSARILAARPSRMMDTTRRSILSVTGQFPKNLEPDTLEWVERHWRPRLRDSLPKV